MICPEHELSLQRIPHKTFSSRNDRGWQNFIVQLIYLFSSWIEAFSLPPLEAMACGTPVVRQTLELFLQGFRKCLHYFTKKSIITRNSILAFMFSEY